MHLNSSKTCLAKSAAGPHLSTVPPPASKFARWDEAYADEMDCVFPACVAFASRETLERERARRSGPESLSREIRKDSLRRTCGDFTGTQQPLLEAVQGEVANSPCFADAELSPLDSRLSIRSPAKAGSDVITPQSIVHHARGGAVKCRGNSPSVPLHPAQRILIMGVLAADGSLQAGFPPVTRRPSVTA